MTRRRVVVVGLVAVAAAAAVRVAIEPRALPWPELAPLTVSPPPIDLAAATASARVLLLGESHGDPTPQRCAIQLLNALGGKTVLVVELPRHAQASIDAGDVDGAVHDALDLRELLRWGKDHAVAIVAADEERARVIRNRALGTDTRNQTFADAIRDARARFPDARVVFYGGMLHTLKAGRYMYDDASRVPIGARLADDGVADAQTVLLNDEPSLPAGAYAVVGELAALPADQLVRAPLARVTRAGEVADYVLSCPRPRA